MRSASRVSASAGVSMMQVSTEQIAAIAIIRRRYMDVPPARDTHSIEDTVPPRGLANKRWLTPTKVGGEKLGDLPIQVSLYPRSLSPTLPPWRLVRTIPGDTLSRRRRR